MIRAALKSARDGAHPDWHPAINKHLPEGILAMQRWAFVLNLSEEEFVRELSPPPDKIFALLSHPPAHYDFVIIGQGPYPTHAQGISSSKNPADLQEIFAAVKQCQPDALIEGNTLDNWVEQGVLLLNVQLTKTNDYKFWQALTRSVLKLWTRTVSTPKILAWGEIAKKTCKGLPGVLDYSERLRRHFRNNPIDWGTRAHFLEIYTDGSAWGPPLPQGGMDADGEGARAGGGVYVRWHTAGGTVTEHEIMVGVAGRPTAQRAELCALRSALRFLCRTHWKKCVIYSDSMYAINQTNGSWKINQNHSLVYSCRATYEHAIKRGDIPMIHMRGHRKDKRRELHAGNERADRVAERASLHFSM